MTWLVTANTNTCRIYHFERKGFVLTLLKEFEHPEIKEKRSEHLTTDKPGKYQSNGSKHGAYEAKSDPREVEIDRFTREITDALNQARNANAFESLIVVAAPAMLGRLSKHLDKHVTKLITKEIQKDIIGLSHHELTQYIENEIKTLK